MEDRAVLENITSPNSAFIMRQLNTLFEDFLSLEDYIEFTKTIIDSKNEALFFAYLKVCSRILYDQKYKRYSSLAFQHLIYFCTKNMNIHISDSAFETLVRFLNHTDISPYFKVSLVRQNWNSFNLEEKYIITKEFGNRRVVELLPLFSSNLELDDDLLSILTINVFSKTEDGRLLEPAKSLVRNTQNIKLITAALDYISKCGNLFDTIFIKEFLKSENIVIKRAAMKALLNIAPFAAIENIALEYNKSHDLNINKDYLKLLAEIHTREAYDFLLFEYLNTHFVELKNVIQWILGKANWTLLLPIVEKIYRSTRESNKIRLLLILRESQNLGVAHYLVSLFYKESHTIQLVVISILSNFDNILGVRKILMSNIYSNYEMISLLSIKGLSRNLTSDEASELLRFLASVRIDDPRHLYFLNGIQKNEIFFSDEDSTVYWNNLTRSSEKELVKKAFNTGYLFSPEPVLRRCFNIFCQLDLRNIYQKELSEAYLNVLSNNEKLYNNQEIELLQSSLKLKPDNFDRLENIAIHLVNSEEFDSIDLIRVYGPSSFMKIIEHRFSDFFSSSNINKKLLTYLHLNDFILPFKVLERLTSKVYSKIESKYQKYIFDLIKISKNLSLYTFLLDESYVLIEDTNEREQLLLDYLGEMK